MKRSVLLEVEGRAKVVVVNGKNASKLREAFMDMCHRDPVLSGRVKTHYATFATFSTDFDTHIELEDNDEITQGQKIRVHFASYAADETPEDDSESHNAKEQSGSNQDLVFLKSIGMRVTCPSTATSHDKSTASSSHVKPLQAISTNTNRKGTQQTPASARNTLLSRTDSSSSDDGNEYYNSSVVAQKRNLAFINENKIGSAKQLVLKPKKGKPRQKFGDENTRPTRSQPLRAVKSKRTTESVLDSEPEAEREVEPEAGPAAKSTDQYVSLFDDLECEDDSVADEVEKRAAKKKKPEKRTRLIGQRITKYTPLPPFPQDLKDSLEKGLVYVEQTHTKKMNDFLKSHVRSVTKDSYPETDEYKTLETQIMARLSNMNVPNLELVESHVVRSLSASLRNDRSWEKNKKPKYLAAKQMLKLADNTGAQSSLSQEAATLDATEADLILKLPVRNKDTVRTALGAASSITPNAIHNLSVQSAVDTYPYLKHPDLVMHDFANRVESTFQKFEENFENALFPLFTILSVDEIPKDELAKAQLLLDVNGYFEDDDQHFPCIQMCDVAIQANNVFQTIPEGQAPALIIVANDKDLVSAIVIMNKEPFLTITTPKAFECLALLLAVYFVFNIEYPKAYKKLLLTFEYIICGEKKIANINNAVRSFFRKFFAAEKLSV